MKSHRPVTGRPWYRTSIVSQPRELRSLVPAELVAVLALVVAPLPATVPIALPLLIVASLSRWVRGRSWAELVHGGLERALVGAVVGAVALGLAVLAGTPVIEAMSARAIEWSAYPLVRGNTQAFAMFAVTVGFTALASELVLRGWIVERMLELSPGPPYFPVFIGAIAEALITPGDVAARFGAGLFGLGLGWMYVAGGRSVLAPICARVVFAVGALVLESMRVVG
jgi:hypothetical protein